MAFAAAPPTHNRVSRAPLDSVEPTESHASGNRKGPGRQAGAADACHCSRLENCGIGHNSRILELAGN